MDVQTKVTLITMRSFEVWNDKSCIGRVNLLIQPKPQGRDGAVIEDVWVDDAHRREGIATVLMKQAIAHATSLGCYKIVLICDPDGPAYGLYRKLGFTDHQQGMRLSL